MWTWAVDLDWGFPHVGWFGSCADAHHKGFCSICMYCRRAELSRDPSLFVHRTYVTLVALGHAWFHREILRCAAIDLVHTRGVWYVSTLKRLCRQSGTVFRWHKPPLIYIDGSSLPAVGHLWMSAAANGWRWSLSRDTWPGIVIWGHFCPQEGDLEDWGALSYGPLHPWLHGWAWCQDSVAWRWESGNAWFVGLSVAAELPTGNLIFG